MRIFLEFSRDVLIKTLRLSYRLSHLVVWEPQKFSIIQKITRLSVLRPFGCTLLLSCYLNGKAELWTIDPSGAAFGYKGATAGKAKNNAKTEIEKLDLENLTVDQALKEAARIIHSVHDEVKGKVHFLSLSFNQSRHGVDKRPPRFSK